MQCLIPNQWCHHWADTALLTNGQDSVFLMSDVTEWKKWLLFRSHCQQKKGLNCGKFPEVSIPELGVLRLVLPKLHSGVFFKEISTAAPLRGTCWRTHHWEREERADSTTGLAPTTSVVSGMCSTTVLQSLTEFTEVCNLDQIMNQRCRHS